MLLEHGFGEFQQKFHILVKDFELWYVEDIMEIVECCIFFHNMMVSEQVARVEPENTSWYKCTNEDDDEDNNSEQLNDLDLEYMEHCEAELALHHCLELKFYDGTTAYLYAQHRARDTEWNTICMKAAYCQWDCLYDREFHFKLCNAIISQLVMNQNAMTDDNGDKKKGNVWGHVSLATYI
jgi:hypothetical protein